MLYDQRNYDYKIFSNINQLKNCGQGKKLYCYTQGKPFIAIFNVSNDYKYSKMTE